MYFVLNVWPWIIIKVEGIDEYHTKCLMSKRLMSITLTSLGDFVNGFTNYVICMIYSCHLVEMVK